MKKIKINCIEDLENLNYLNSNGEYYISLERNLDFEDINSYKDKNNYYKFLESKKSNGFNVINMENKIFIFNGNNCVISNLVISREKEDNVGLFKNISNSIIKNLNIDNAYIEGRIKVGIIAGTMEGEIINTNINGNVNGKLLVGGFVGESKEKIYFCNNKMNGNISGNAFIGGLLGKGENSIIFDNEVDSKILYNQIKSWETINEYVGYSSHSIVREKDYRKRPFISYEGIGGFILK